MRLASVPSGGSLRTFGAMSAFRPSRSLVVVAAACLIAGCADARSPELDLLVRGGTIVDGSGGPTYTGDVGVRGGVIVLVGSVDATAVDTLDAAGLVVAPGFVDVHSHTAPAIASPERRWNEGVLRQGVTTVVGGPDGGLEPDDLRHLASAYEANGVGTNVAFYVGHNAIRRRAMGEGEARKRPPDAEELARMKALVREGMELGAVGLSTGLMYDPGMFSETSEVVALAREVAPFGGIYDSHVRNPVHALLASDREVVEIAQSAGVPGKIAHLKAVGLHNEGAMADVIALVEDARARGIDIVSDQYPYDGAATAALTDIIVVPEELADENGEVDLAGALAEPAVRAWLRETSEEGIDGGFAWLKATGYTSMRITSAPAAPDLEGRYLSGIAEERGVDPFDVVAELVMGEAPVRITLGAIHETDVEALMARSWNMIASDGAYADGSDRADGHPRGAGTFPRFLARYVRDRGLMSLEEAIRKITSLPAGFVGLADRGRIAEGAAADLTVFDPAAIADRSTWAHPHRFAVGVRHVVVNGVPAIRDGELTGRTSGRFLPRSRPD